MKKTILLCLSFATFGSLAQPQNPSFTDTWQFSISALAQENDATLRATNPGFSEINITLDDLGLDDSNTVLQLGARWRFRDNWSMNFIYSDFDLSGSRTIKTSFNYSGEVYPIDATVGTKLKAAFYIASLEYAFSQTDTTEWSIGAGLHIIDFDVGLGGRFNNTTLSFVNEDFVAPLPNLHLSVKHAFSPKLMGQIGLGWLKGSFDVYSGDLLLSTAALEYRISDRWTLGANYQLTDIDFEINNSQREDAYDIELTGFALTLIYSLP